MGGDNYPGGWMERGCNGNAGGCGRSARGRRLGGTNGRMRSSPAAAKSAKTGCATGIQAALRPERTGKALTRANGGMDRKMRPSPGAAKSAKTGCATGMQAALRPERKGKALTRPNGGMDRKMRPSPAAAKSAKTGCATGIQSAAAGAHREGAVMGRKDLQLSHITGVQAN